MLLVLKLILTPVLIAGASLGGRRWGPTVGGWLVSLPLTSGPVALFVALDHGTAFAAATAGASLAGNIAICAFCLIYARAASHVGWVGSLVVAALGWTVACLAVQAVLGLAVGIVFAAAIAAIAIAYRLMPDGTTRPSTVEAPFWDLALRMLVGTSVVVGVTAAAPFVGAGTSGLLAMLPVMAAVLTVFAHHRDGSAAGVGVLRGLLTGLAGTATFLAVLAAALVPFGVAPAFTLAIVTVAAIQSIAFRAVRRAGNADATASVPATALDPVRS